MREWEGRCAYCRRRWRLQLEPDSDDLHVTLVTIPCPGGHPGEVFLSETATSRRVNEVVDKLHADQVIETFEETAQ